MAESGQTLKLTLRLYRFAAKHWVLVVCSFLAGACYAGFRMYYLKLIEPVIKAFTTAKSGADDIDAALTDAMKASSLKDAVAEVARAKGAPKREVYARALALAKDGAP